mmetsp:Transcript_11580/g.24609  ORF Transcript_11580/g.24609 Transcript_11580/m.24609 type:complete len:243 (-) Transcript_11580:338-1066(-)
MREVVPHSPASSSSAATAVAPAAASVSSVLRLAAPHPDPSSRVGLVLVPRRGRLDLHELPFKLVEPALGEDLLRGFLRREGDESKPPGPAGVVVLQNLALRDLSKLLKVLPEVLVRGLRAQAAHEDLPPLRCCLRLPASRAGALPGSRRYLRLHHAPVNGVLVVAGGLGLAPLGQRDESEAARAHGPRVPHYQHLNNLTVLFEDFLQRLLRCLPGKPADKEFDGSVFIFAGLAFAQLQFGEV